MNSIGTMIILFMIADSRIEGIGLLLVEPLALRPASGAACGVPAETTLHNLSNCGERAPRQGRSRTQFPNDGARSCGRWNRSRKNTEQSPEPEVWTSRETLGELRLVV